MLPLSLDLTKLRLALVGNGPTAARRLAWLDEAGAVLVMSVHGQLHGEVCGVTSAMSVKPLGWIVTSKPATVGSTGQTLTSMAVV